MKHHRVYFTKTVGSSIAIVSLTVMLFITACGGYGGGSISPTVGSSTATICTAGSANRSGRTASHLCKPIFYNHDCVMGHFDQPDTLQLLNQSKQEIIVFDTVVNHIQNAGVTSNYTITASIPAGLLRNQQPITEVNITGKKDTLKMGGTALKKGQEVIIAAELNQTPNSLTGIQILPSDSNKVKNCRDVVEFNMIPTVGQNGTITYWQVGDQPLSVKLDASIDVTKPVQVFTLFKAGYVPAVLKVQNLE